MSKSDMITVEGTVVDILPGSKFKVKLNEKNIEITCGISGKLRMNNIRIITGDRVSVDMSPYDITKGRITWRYK